MDIYTFDSINPAVANRETLLAALEWNDPNGDYDECSDEELRECLRAQQSPLSD